MHVEACRDWTLTWEDQFTRLPPRLERIQQRHDGVKLLANNLINVRASAVLLIRS
jgi:hypothetical protein